MRAKIIGVVLSIILVFFSFNCQEEKKTIPGEEGKVAPPVKKQETNIPSVCIWDYTSVKAEPSQKSNSISTLVLGEKVNYLREDKLDANDRNQKYCKVRLSDGKEGWVLEENLAIDAMPAITVSKAIIYLRPDLVTITDKDFPPMEFVAVSKLQNEWCEAKGREGKKIGWIKSESVSMKEEDITVGLLAGKALAETDKNKKKQKIQAILNNPSFANSIFIDTLKKSLSRIPFWEEEEERYYDDEEDIDEIEE